MGIGAHGEELNACIRRMSAYEKEEVLASGVRFLLSNRIAYGLSTLKFGTFCKGEEYNKTATLADFSPVSVEEMGNHYLANDDMEHAGRYPSQLTSLIGVFATEI